MRALVPLALSILLAACSGGANEVEQESAAGRAEPSASSTATPSSRLSASALPTSAAPLQPTVQARPSPSAAQPSASAGPSRGPQTPVASSAPSPRPTARATTQQPAPSPPASSPPPPPTRAAPTPLTIEDFAFHPRTMTVTAGTTVRATNKDEASHTWTSDTGVWDSGSLAQGEAFSFTFSTPGTFTFHCTPHPTMTGSIVVR